jgi:hypothetical protein
MTLMGRYRNRLIRWWRGLCQQCGGPKVDWARHSSCDVCPLCDLVTIRDNRAIDPIGRKGL